MKANKSEFARGGAVQSRKLLAAFAVLAVVFAAFAVVGIGSDSDAAISSMETIDADEFTNATESSISTGNYYAKSDVSLTITGDEAFVVVKDGKSVTIVYNSNPHVITLAVGTLLDDGSLQYDENTVVQYTTASGDNAVKFKAVAATDSATGYYVLTSTTQNGSVGTGIVATESTAASGGTTTVKVYSLNAVGVKAVLKDATKDSVQVSAPANEEFTTDLTVTYGSNTVSVAATTSEAKTDLNLNAGSSIFSIKASSAFAGTITVNKGSIKDLTTSDDDHLFGQIAGIALLSAANGNNTWYPLSGNTAMTITNGNIVQLPAGTETTGAFKFFTDPTTSSTLMITIPSGFSVAENDDATEALQLTYATGTGGQVTIASFAGTEGKADWTGTLNVDAAETVLSAGNMGAIDAKAAGYGATDLGSASEVSLNGKLTLSGALTITGHSDTTKNTATISMDTGASLKVDGGVVLKNAQSRLEIAAGISASATITDGTYSSEFDEVTPMTGGLTVAQSTTTLTLTGSYSVGTITSSDITAVDTSENAVICGIEVANATITPTTLLRINGNAVIKDICDDVTVVFAGKTAEMTGADYDGKENVITISESTTMTLSGTLAMGTTAGPRLNVLGQITGGTITGSNVTIFTSDGTDSSHIKSTYEGSVTEASYETVIGVNSTHFADAVDAISLGFNLVTLGGAMDVTESYEIPSDVIISGAFGITVSADKTLTVRGEISEATAITLEEGTKTDTSGNTVLYNEGKITLSTGTFTAPVRSYVVNAGTLDLSGVNTNNSVFNGLTENNGTIILPSTTETFTIGNASDAAEFSNNGTIQVGGSKIVVASKSTLENRGTIDSDDSSAEIKGAGTFSNQSSGTVGIYVNTAYVTGNTSTVKIEEDMTQKTTYMSLQTLKVPEGANLNLTNVAKIGVNGKFIIDGTLTIYGKLTIAAADFAAQSAALELNGKIVIAKGGELIIGQTSSTDHLAGLGKLTVAEGASIVVEDGGKLTINQGEARISGSLTMDTGSELTVDASTSAGSKAAGTLKVYGTADLNGYLNDDMTISNYGSIAIDNGSNAVRYQTNGSLSGSATEDVVIEMAANGAVLTIDTFLLESGVATTLTVTDAGLYTYYDSTGKTENKSIPADNCNRIAIEFEDNDSPTKAVVDGTLVIKESASYKSVTAVKDKSQTYSMDVSGEISGAFTYSSTNDSVDDLVTLDIQVAGTEYFDAAKKYVSHAGSIAVSGELELGQYVSTSVSSADDMNGVLTVSGSISNDGTGAKKIVAERGSTITVTGEIVSSNQIDVSSGGKVNAVYYTTKIQVDKTKVDTYYYTTLDEAIAGVQVEGNLNTKVVKIIGSVTLTEDAVLPEDVSMQFYDSSSKLKVGTTSARATLTAESVIETLTSRQITVDGTLTFSDKTDDKTSKTVSDVTYESSDADGYRTYTNVYTAIEQAGQSADAMTITVTKEAGTSGDEKVELDSNLNIPSNVTLVVGDSVHVAGLYLYDGVTLTVDGVLKTSQDIAAESRFAANAIDTDSVQTSAVVVNGKLMVSDEQTVTYGAGLADGATNATALFASASTPVYGAYYSIQGWNVISNFDDALAETGITTAAVTVNGPVVGSDVTVTKNDDFKGVTVGSTTIKTVGPNAANVATSLKVNSITLGSSTSVDMTGAFTGSVVVGDNSVDFVKISGVKAANSSGALVLTGTATTAKDSSLTVAAGAVSLGSSSASFAQEGTVFYAMTIASGASAKVVKSDGIESLVVDGTFEVPAGASVAVDYIQVNGTVKVEETTSTAVGGTLTIGTGFVGMTSYDIISTGAAASVTGPFTLTDILFVVSSATVDQDMTGYYATAFYNGGSLWFTAYAADADADVTVNKAPITNAVLSGWSATDGGDVAYDADAKITIGAYDKLYSVVKTDIYKIVIRADQGIGDLYLNGNIMSKGTIMTGNLTSGNYESYYAYYATVEAGDYTVTCKLANGFSGTPGLKDSTGATVSANKITVSGTPAEGKDTITVEYQLTGVEASGYVQPTEEKDDSGLTVTDYLLIVLVILVVVLAVIVALRLMRS